jgi:hypothetical protein
MGLGLSGSGLNLVYPFKTQKFSCLAGLLAEFGGLTRQTRLIFGSSELTCQTRLKKKRKKKGEKIIKPKTKD